jgi:hypothetical protein
MNLLDLKKVKSAIENRIKNGLSLDIQEDILSPEQEIELEMIDIFHRFDILGNYTNHKWVFNLNVIQLRNLYRKTEDMFNYRVGLSKEQLCSYVKYGIIFKSKINIIDKIIDKNILRKIIMEEYLKVLNYDNLEADKKTAVMWLLTALTEVSLQARTAMPHLDQGLLF